MPSRRAVWWWSAAGAALLLGAPGWMVYSAVTAAPAGCGPETAEALNELQELLRTGGVDAGPILSDLAVRFDELQQSWSAEIGESSSITMEVEPLLAGAWGDPRQEDARRLWSRVRVVLTDIHGAGAADDFVLLFNPGVEPGEPVRGEDLVDPVVVKLRAVVMLLRVEMREYAEAGDWPGAVRALRTCLRLARHMSSSPLLIHRLIADGARLAGVLELRLLVHEHAIPADACAELLGVLGDVACEPRPVSHMLVGERIYTLAGLSSMYDSSGRELTWEMDRQLAIDDADALVASWMEDGSPTPLSRIANIRTFFRPSRAAAERTVNAMYDDLVAWTSLPVHQRPHPVPFSPAARAHPIFETLSRMVPRAIEGLGLNQSHLAAATVMLRLESFHAAHGRWPASLSEAMTETESIDPATGQPFTYRLIAHDSAGRAYSLKTEGTFREPGISPMDDLPSNDAELAIPRGPIDDDTFPHLKWRREKLERGAKPEDDSAP